MTPKTLKYIFILILATITALGFYSMSKDIPTGKRANAASERVTIDSLKEKRDQILIQKKDQEYKKESLIKDKDKAIKDFESEIDKVNKNITSVSSDLDIAEARLKESLEPTK